MTFFCSDFHAAENSCPRVSKPSPSTPARWVFASSFTAANASSRAWRSGTIAASSLPAKFVHSSSQMSWPYSGVGVNSLGVTPCAATNSAWNAITFAISAFATSSPWARISSVGATAPAPWASSGHVLTGASPSIMRMSTPPSAFFEPATTMSNVASSVSWNVGFTTQSLPIRPSRTDPTGPSNGRPARLTAQAAAFIAGTS